MRSPQVEADAFGILALEATFGANPMQRFPWLASLDESNAGAAALRSVAPFDEAFEPERLAYRRDLQMLKSYISQLEQKISDLKRWDGLRRGAWAFLLCP